jgi:hypothetical protein
MLFFVSNSFHFIQWSGVSRKNKKLAGGTGLTRHSEEVSINGLIGKYLIRAARDSDIMQQ